MTDVVGEDPEGVALVTLEEAKRHLRVDFADDDTLIAAYVAAAEAAVLNYVNRDDVPEGERARAAFRVAVLLIAGDFYSNRETEQTDVPVAARLLLDPYRMLRV